jgi:PAS domain S-box-containing protein
LKLPEFNRTLRQLVALPILLLVLMAGFLVWQIVATARAQQQLDHSDQVTSQVEKLQSLFIDQETGLRGFQLTGDQVMLAPWEAAAGPIQVQFATLHGLLAADPQQSATLRDLEDRYNRWLQFARGVLAKDPKLIADPHVNQRGKQMMDGIRATAGLLQAREANMRQAQYRRAQALQGRELVSLLLSALLVGVVLALFTRHHVKTISVSYVRTIDEITGQSEALFESQQWFQTTLESIGDAVIACDIHGSVSFMNAVAENLTGWKLADAKGHPLEAVFRIVSEDTRQPAENPVEKVRRLRQVIGLANHTALLARDGREFIIDDSAAPILSGAGEMIGVVLVFRDVTEERRMESALVASEKLAVAGRLAASIAHEIHNPLDSVANLHYLLGLENDLEKRAEYLRLAQQELGRTMQISRTMLSLYREPRAPISLNLRELIEGVLLLLDRRMKHLGIQLEAQLSEPLVVEGFPAELRQVFTNLISNAIDAAGPKGRIRIRMEHAEAEELHGAGAIVEITDNGVGIPTDLLPKLFQPFFTTKGATGTGLGLWVSMGIVQKHGGAIKIGNSSEPGLPGASIRVFLPARTLAQSVEKAGC